MKCKNCANYLDKLDTCKFCSFEEDNSSSIPPFNIFEYADLDYNWEIIHKHLQDNGIECLTVDTWFDLDMMIIVGCYAHSSDVARVLGVHREVVYDWSDNGLIIVNLFQEKWLRRRL